MLVALGLATGAWAQQAPEATDVTPDVTAEDILPPLPPATDTPAMESADQPATAAESAAAEAPESETAAPNATAAGPPARPAATLPDSPPGATIFSRTLELAKFVPTPGPLRLQDSMAQADLFVPFSPRFQAERLRLDLRFTNSIALVPDRSVLTIRFNQATLGQIRLEPNDPTVTAAINIPTDLAEPGFNALTFFATQHYESNCEDPESPELWTEIDTTRSTLRILGRIDNSGVTLADLAGVFGPGMGAVRELLMLTPPQSLSPERLHALGLVTQGAALRAEYEPMGFVQEYWRTDAGGYDLGYLPAGTAKVDAHAMVATRDELAGILPASLTDRITGPFLALQPVGDDDHTLRLIVSGRDMAEVTTAARALTILDFPFTDAPFMVIKELVPASARRPLGFGRFLAPDREYTFRELGFRSTTAMSAGQKRFEITVPMPPNLYEEEGAMVELYLDLAYGAGLGPGSVLNITVNETFVQGILFDNNQGGRFREYKLLLPLRVFGPGDNTLILDSVLRPPAVIGECAGVKGRHLAFALYDTSRLVLPAAGAVAGQPDLRLFAGTGFPYYLPQAPVDSTFHVLDPALLPAAWEVLARMAQVAKAPMAHVSVALGRPESITGNALVIGPVDLLPDDLFAQMSYGVGRINKVPYRLLRGPEGRPAEGPLTGFFNAVEDLFSDAADGVGVLAGEERSDGYLAQVNSLGDNGVITAVQSPDGADATITVITGQGSALVDQAVDRLVQPAFWNRIGGDIAIWNDEPETVVSLTVHRQYQIGEASPWLTVRYALSRNPWEWIGGTVVVILLLAATTRWLLRRRRRNLSIPE